MNFVKMPTKRITFEDLLSLVVSAVANLALGFITLHPALFAALAVSVELFGELSTEYNSNPGVYRGVGIASGVLLVALLLAVNACLIFVLPGRARWIWLGALATYPIPFLFNVWPLR